MKKTVCGTTLLFISAASVIISGCSTPTIPENTHHAWKADKNIRESLEKITFINQQQPDPQSISKSLSLSELLDIALNNNPTIHSAWEKARAQQAAVKQEQSAFYPTINIGGSAARQKSDDNDTSTDMDITTYGPEANLTWMLVDFGGRIGRVRSAAQQLIAQNYTFNRTLQDVMLSVITAYYNLYSSQFAIEAAIANTKDYEQTLDAAQQRTKAGLATKLDVLQAEANYENALYAQAEAEGNNLTYQGMLARAIGYPADTPLKITFPTNDTVPEITQDTIQELTDKALYKRPDMMALRAQTKAYQASIAAERSDFWPTLSAGAQANQNWYRYSDSSALEDRDGHTYEASLQLQWNIFDGFLTLNKKRMAQAQYEDALKQLEDAELQLSEEVWTKYYTLTTAYKKLSFSQSFFDSSKESYQLALDSYNNGLSSILDIFQAQSSLSDARSKLVSSRQEVFLALTELAYVIGNIEDFEIYSRK